MKAREAGRSRSKSGSGAAHRPGTRRHDARRADIFPRIAAKHASTLQALRDLIGVSELLGANPALQRAIRSRFAYLGPLNHVQHELLRRFGDGAQGQRPSLRIHLSINGIAAGLRNSG